MFTSNTAVLTPLIQPGQLFYNIKNFKGGLITFPGGVVIKNDAGEVIGAIGVSGSVVENDRAVAEACAKAVK